MYSLGLHSSDRLLYNTEIRRVLFTPTCMPTSSTSQIWTPEESKERRLLWEADRVLERIDTMTSEETPRDVRIELHKSVRGQLLEEPELIGYWWKARCQHGPVRSAVWCLRTGELSEDLIYRGLLEALREGDYPRLGRLINEGADISCQDYALVPSVLATSSTELIQWFIPKVPLAVLEEQLTEDYPAQSLLRDHIHERRSRIKSARLVA